jgi:hypothetical protein
MELPYKICVMCENVRYGQSTVARDDDGALTIDDKCDAYCVLRDPSLDACRSTCASCRLPSVVHRPPSGDSSWLRLGCVQWNTEEVNETLRK